MLKILSLVLALGIVSAAADAASLPPGMTPSASNALPSALGNLGVPFGNTSYIRTWKQITSQVAIDSSGSVFYPSSVSRTGYGWIELDDDALAVKIGFQNQSANAYTITDMTVAGSSELALQNYTSFTQGATAYDSNETAATQLCGQTNTAICWYPVTFGNGGADSQFPPGYSPPASPVNSVTYTTSGTSAGGGTTLNFGITQPANVLVGMKVIIPATTTNTTGYTVLPTEDEYVTAVSGAGCSPTCTVTIGPAPIKTTAPSGTVVSFLPLNLVVAGATAPPVPNVVYSDWTPIQTYPALDRYPLNSQTVTGPAGLAANTTVSARPTLGNVPITPATTGVIPSGTTFTTCSNVVTTNAITPNYTAPFTNTAGIVPGMQVTYGGVSSTISGVGNGYINGRTLTSPQGAYNNTVASVVANTSVTFTSPIDSDAQSGPSATWASGDKVQFTQPATLTANAAQGATTLFITTGLTINNGMTVFGTNIPALATTVSAYNSTTGELDLTGAGLTAALTAGTPLGISILYPTSGTIVTGASFNTTITGNSNWPVVGGYVRDANGDFPAKDPIYQNNSTTYTYLWSAQNTVASGSTVQICRDFVTNATIPAGATTLTINQPKRWMLYHINFGSSNANYGGYNMNVHALRVTEYGLKEWAGGQCGTGVDGVLTPSNCGNSSSGMGRAGGVVPIIEVQSWSPRKGLTIAMASGDSHFDPSTSKDFGIAEYLASQLSTPNFPVSGVETAWGGQTSPVFVDNSYSFIKSFKPDIALIPVMTFNDAADNNSYAFLQSQTMALINYVKSYGGTPIMLTEYDRQILGCNTTITATEPYRLANIAYWDNVALSGTLEYDPYKIADPTNSGYFTPAYSWDCVHGNDTMMAGIAGALQSIISKTYLNRAP